MINIIGNHNTIFNHFIAEIRDQHIQKDRVRFRKNLQRIGEIFAYEISKRLLYKEQEVKTPFGFASAQVVEDEILIAALLRAGLPIQQGLLNFFDWADTAFISIHREHNKENDFEVEVDYVSSPSVEKKVVILTDAMIATGSTMTHAYKSLLDLGTPRHTHIVSLIASMDGIEYIKKKLPESSFTLWVGAVDEELTVKSFVVPGLGDAGDLAYGIKKKPKDEEEDYEE